MKITSIDDDGYTSEPINNYIDDENDSINIYLENTYIYGWGRNTYGEIGVGSNENVFLPSPIKTLNSQLASKLEDAPWPATKDELIDYAVRSGAPLEVIENLQEIEDEGDVYESIEDIWPDYPSKEDFFFDEEEY